LALALAVFFSFLSFNFELVSYREFAVPNFCGRTYLLVSGGGIDVCAFRTGKRQSRFFGMFFVIE
jgi:hypothetical protein